MKFRLLTILLAISLVSFAQKNYLLVGTYTSGKSTGIYVYNFNEANGTAKVVDSAKTYNPSYLAVAPNKQFIYAVNEGVPNDSLGRVVAFSFDSQTGHLKELNEQSSMGNSPCYVVVDKTGKWVIVGNYGSGTLAVLPIQKDGSLGKAVTTIRHQGQGVDKERQEGPHVHSTVLSADNRYLFVADLGIDKEMIYAFNDKTGSLTPAREPFVKLQDGSGPRHFVFHPNGRWAYLTQEMTATVTALRYVNGGLHSVQTINSLPAGYKGPKRTADIHVSPDGKFLYSSDRDSANTIAIFKIDQNNGTLKLVGHQSVMGKTPRNFNFDPSGNYLLVANQNSDNIVVFQVDHQTGRLKYTGHQIPVGNPVCIKWISK